MKKNKFLLCILAVAMTGALFVACKKSSYSSNNGNNNPTTISIKSSGFSNANLQVMTGANVIWKNDDSTAHTVTANDGSFDSGNIQPGSSYNHSFSSAGTFAYHDKIKTSLTGVVVVTASPPSGGY